MNLNKTARLILIIMVIVFAFFKIYSVYKKNNPSHSQSSDPFNRNTSHLILTKHALCRMQCREITESEIKEIVNDGNINYGKSEVNDARGPKYAMEGYSHEHQHLRIVVAPENDGLVVVTCIDLDKEWPCPSCN
ncbi:MAG: DUF4258 domain-containing protein [Chitinophagaceae bacterium]|nr:DUF4258 domain-containing protein [Chitinophagaceae bacterium]